MVVVKMEVWPGGDESKAYPLGRIDIINDGTGDVVRGNYKVRAAHAGIFFGKRREPYKTGRFTGFVRRWSPYRLLSRALAAINEGS